MFNGLLILHLQLAVSDSIADISCVLSHYWNWCSRLVVLITHYTVHTAHLCSIVSIHSLNWKNDSSVCKSNQTELNYVCDLECSNKQQVSKQQHVEKRRTIKAMPSFLPRNADYAIAKMTARLSVTHRYSVKMVIYILKCFSPSGSHIILDFAYQTVQLYSDGEPP